MPQDPAGFPVTRTPAGVARSARGTRDLAVLDARISGCRACPRLVAWREEVAREKRASFREQDYWGRPVPGLGPADARRGRVLGRGSAAHGVPGGVTELPDGDPRGDRRAGAQELPGQRCLLLPLPGHPAIMPPRAAPARAQVVCW